LTDELPAHRRGIQLATRPGLRPPSKPQKVHSMPPKKSVVCQRFGKAVRVTRERAGYSQDKFALHADMDRSCFGAIERGEINVSLSTIIKIATALNTKPSALFRLASL